MTVGFAVNFSPFCTLKLTGILTRFVNEFIVILNTSTRSYSCPATDVISSEFVLTRGS